MPAPLATPLSFSHRLDRRRFLRTLFCSSAALALNVKPRRVAAAGLSGDLHLIAVGDYGSGDEKQAAVAAAMRLYVEQQKLKPEWLLMLGDNFYKSSRLGGVSPARWKAGFEEMYPQDAFPCPCPAVLGNHDYYDDAPQQLAYAKAGGTRWTLPAKWYRMELGGVATFLFIDTNLRGPGGKLPSGGAPTPFLTPEEESAQWRWLDAQLAASRAGFTVVVGHHPVYSNGMHGDTRELVAKLAPRLEKGGVHLYLCGHDHDLQHLEAKGSRTSFALSGGGGARIRELKKPERTMPYGRAVHGFSHLQLNADRILVRHVDVSGVQLHAFEKALDYSWRLAV